MTVLMLAAFKGYVEIIDFLLKSNADPDLQDIYGHTALILASDQGHIDSVRSLVEGGADIRLKTRSKLSALDVAFNHNHAQVANFLLDHIISGGYCLGALLSKNNIH